MLVRQIGTTDAQAILDASGVSPAAVQAGSSPASSGVQVEYLSTEVDTPAPVDVPKHPLLWAGLGLGTAFLLSRGGGTVGSTKKKGILIPVLIVGGLAAWWFLKPEDTSVPGASATDNVTTDANRAGLQSTYASQPKELAAVNVADSATLKKWALLVSVWSTSGNPYGVDINGNPTTNAGASLGSWWETFKKQNGFA